MPFFTLGRKRKEEGEERYFVYKFIHTSVVAHYNTDWLGSLCALCRAKASFWKFSKFKPEKSVFESVSRYCFSQVDLLLTVIHSECRCVPICRRSGFSSQSDLAQEFKTTDDEVKFGCNSQFVSMILLAVAALFFTVLAIIYVSVRSRDALSFGLEDKGEFSCSHVSELSCGTEGRMITLCSFLQQTPSQSVHKRWAGPSLLHLRWGKLVLPAVKLNDHRINCGSLWKLFRHRMFWSWKILMEHYKKWCMTKYLHIAHSALEAVLLFLRQMRIFLVVFIMCCRQNNLWL
jgi:hypothetical protein